LGLTPPNHVSRPRERVVADQAVTEVICSNPAFVNASAEELDAVTEGLERYLTTKLYPLYALCHTRGTDSSAASLR